MNRSETIPTRTTTFPNTPYSLNFTYYNNSTYDNNNNSNTNLLTHHKTYRHLRTESSDTVVSSAFSSESEESDSGSATKEKPQIDRSRRRQVKEVKAQKVESAVDRDRKVKSNVVEFGFADKNGVPVDPPLDKSMFEKLKFWKRKKTSSEGLPVTTNVTNQYKEKKNRSCCGCCGIIIIILLLLLLFVNVILLDVNFSKLHDTIITQSGNGGSNGSNGNGTGTEGNGTSGNNWNNSAPLTPEDLKVKSLVCLALFGSLGSTLPKQFPCQDCTNDPNVFYNVSTFCVLKDIWANAVNQSSFEQNLRWMQDNNFCEWGGISCDNARRIIGLNLINPNIPSTLSDDMGNLGSLQNLSISGNGALPNNQIPTKLFQLSNLNAISIVSTGLTGGIPDTFNNMKSLKTLVLSRNAKLGNVIPPSIGLTPLTTLTISGQGITGNIPDFIGNSKTLQSNLQNLDLSFNSLTGPIPQSLMNLVSLKSLVLEGNQLNGSIPSIDNTKFPGLTVLNLGINNLTGSIPDSLSTINNLGSLIITSNDVTGNIPPSITKLTNLKQLDLSNNKLNGNIPTEVGNMGLNIILLSKNSLTGTIPGGICQRTYAQCDLSSNSFSSTGSCGQCTL